MVVLHTYHLALAGVPAAVALDDGGATPRGVGALLVGNCWQEGGREKRDGRGLLAFGTQPGWVSWHRQPCFRQTLGNAEAKKQTKPCQSLVALTWVHIPSQVWDSLSPQNCSYPHVAHRSASQCCFLQVPFRVHMQKGSRSSPGDALGGFLQTYRCLGVQGKKSNTPRVSPSPEHSASTRPCLLPLHNCITCAITPKAEHSSLMLSCLQSRCRRSTQGLATPTALLGLAPPALACC